MAESISIPQIPLFKNQGVNFKFLKTFEEFLRSQDLTNKSKILDTIYDHDVIIHYKKVIELAWNNFLKSGNEESKAAHVTPESSSVIYNCIVDFLVGISSYKIKLKIIFDGITPKAYADVISTTSEEEESPHIDSLYPYDNFGASELVKAVQVLKDSNYSHTCMFAPYNATPQIFFLHDNYLASSICGYPDLLLYVYYNFIIDIDLTSGEIEWVKYRKDHNLNKKSCLAKMFLNNGYITQNGEKHKFNTVDSIQRQAFKCNNDDKYFLKDEKLKGICQILENPFILNLEFEVQALSTSTESKAVYHLREDIYGKRHSKIAYFSLFLGKFAPKVLDLQTLGQNEKGKLKPQLVTPLEQKYLKIHSDIFSKAIQNISSASSTEEDKEQGSDLYDPLLVKIINSEEVYELIDGTNEKKLNTFRFTCELLMKYFDEEKETESSTSQTRFNKNHIWTLIILNLLKELNFYTEAGIKDIASFYANVHDLNDDQHLFIILLMIKTGFLLDFSAVTNSEKSLEENAINLVCGVVSLLDIELSEPWNICAIQEDKELKSFYYISNTLKDSIRNYFETSLHRLIHTEQKVRPEEHGKLFNHIKFKDNNGLLFATILKSVLQFKPSTSENQESSFSDALKPWLKYITAEDFISVLMEALNLWELVFQMVTDLSEKSKIRYLGTAFSNGNLVLKSKINELGIDKLL